MITVFGATGYTGQKIAAVLDREGLDYRLAGRSSQKLAEMSSRLSAHPEWLVADAMQPGSLPPLFQGSQVLINCAGPFTDLGERVISQAAMSGSNYLDITNELGYVFRARGYSQMSARTGAALVPACAFEVALSDCAAALAGQKLLEKDAHTEIDRVDVIYAFEEVGASSGTRRSAVRSLATSWIAYREGTWTGQIPGGRVWRFKLPGRTSHAILIPSCESITLPLHLPLRRVDVWMDVSPTLHFWGPLLIPFLARLSRSILKPLILKLAGNISQPAREASGVDQQSKSHFKIFVCAQQGRRTQWVSIEGLNPYNLTAEIAAFAARKLHSGYQKAGLLAPSQVLEPQAFLDHASHHWGLTIREEERPI